MCGADGIVKLTDCKLSSAFLHEATPLNLRRTAIDNLSGFQGEGSCFIIPSGVIFTSTEVHQAPAEGIAAGAAAYTIRSPVASRWFSS